jgi:hypothetical protein
MSTTVKEMPADLRETLRAIRRLALAFHGSELRLTDRTERDAKVLVQA